VHEQTKSMQYYNIQARWSWNRLSTKYEVKVGAFWSRYAKTTILSKHLSIQLLWITLTASFNAMTHIIITNFLKNGCLKI